MYIRSLGKTLSSFQIVILGFLGLILIGAVLLMLPAAARDGCGAPFAECYASFQIPLAGQNSFFTDLARARGLL